MKINPRGYWENETDEGHGVDESIAEALLSFFKHEPKNFLTILDVGCGTGFYTRYLRRGGRFCLGYDGNPHTHLLSERQCGRADFSRPQHLDKFDWVLSLEVGEHIPPKYERIFINNLHRHNERGIVLSWAIPDQGGDGHVNCRSNEYIKGIFASLGYSNDLEAEAELRRAATNCYWLADTLMVFRRGT